jgi:hypothetical protein
VALAVTPSTEVPLCIRLANSEGSLNRIDVRRVGPGKRLSLFRLTEVFLADFLEKNRR